MPKGPKGEKRPADVIGNAGRVMRIATGEETDERAPANPAAELERKGGAARAQFHPGAAAGDRQEGRRLEHPAAPAAPRKLRSRIPERRTAAGRTSGAGRHERVPQPIASSVAQDAERLRPPPAQGHNASAGPAGVVTVALAIG